MIFNRKFWTGIALGGLGGLYLLNFLKEKEEINRQPSKREELEAFANRSQEKGKEFLTNLISRLDLEAADLQNIDKSDLIQKVIEMEDQNK
ncbi:hypothetical protein [Sporohalobacter salinus]|uniref:hypothetical protein n=1 Tax=Sporohalobacter salinus TaxID=1494606 RepID=UPI00195F8DBD|nr:hypothetical protein [Sporohalobacter salinus]MBM7624651.1 hypothetical protein [Sporohalobacter salinus]